MKLKPCPFCGGEMREKLIELLNDHVCLECKDECAEECSSCLADHLLANGVIVLPCKAGQKVYTIQRSAIMEWTVSGIWISADPNNGYILLCRKERENLSRGMDVHFEDINKTVFLTREEAEAALKGEK